MIDNLYLIDQNCIGEDLTCRVRAAVDIPKGTEVTSTYTHTLAGTMWRRKHLSESKYFDCSCKRCADSTELGTNFRKERNMTNLISRQIIIKEV
jgi:hypothetical protein